ncbi:MAG: HAMP domain-containing histidine kinase [Candidatus Manganitrophus sp. SA1]|nr:HAMP domain-containing histidine kinase [Candidatus Manganitrophus morganii]
MKQPIDPLPLPDMHSDPPARDLNFNATRRLVRIIQDLSLARDLERVIAIVRRGARELTGADGATFILREGEVCYYVDEDAISPLWKGKRFLVSACISGWVMLNRQPAVIEDIYSDPRIPADTYRPTFVKSLAMVPIRREAPIGAVGIYWSRKYRSTAEEGELLQALADSTSIAMENIGLYTELRQRAKETEEAARVKSQFVSNVSHELRTPINSILGYAALLHDEIYGPISSEQINATEAILRNARELLSLIESILDLSRMDAGRLSVQAAPVNLSDLLDETIRSVKPFVEKKSVALRWQLDHLPMIRSDTGKTKQILTNLLSNAIKFTHTGEIAITAKNMPHRQGIKIAIADTGIGMRAEDLPRIFDPFYQLQVDSTRPLDGVGLGLAIVKELVSLLQGEISVESEVGKGSTFTLFLPYRLTT